MGALLAVLTSVAGSFVEDWKASRQNQRDVARAVAENKMRLAQSAETHNEDWEMSALEGRDTILRRVSFLIWSAPMIWAAVNPSAASAYFKTALAALPGWYVAGYLSISGAVWGVSALKNAGVIRFPK